MSPDATTTTEICLRWLDVADALVYAARSDGELLFSNQSLQTWSGKETPFPGTIQQLFTTLHPPGEASLLLREIEQHVMGGDGQMVREVPTVDARGLLHPVRWTLRRWETSCDGESNIIALGTDLTEKRRLEQWTALQALLLSKVDEAVLAFDETGRTIHWTGGAAGLLGWSARERLDRPFSEIVAGGNGQALQVDLLNDLESPAEGGRTADILKKDGTPMACRIRYWPFPDVHGRPVGAICLVRPENMEPSSSTVPCESSAEEPHPHDEPHDHPDGGHLHDSGLVAIITTDKEGRVLTWNRAAQRLGGAGQARAMARRVFDEVLNVQGMQWDQIRNRLESRGQIRERARLYRPNGSVADVELELLPRKVDGCCIGATILMIDVTDDSFSGRELLYAKQAALKAMLLRGTVDTLEQVTSTLGPAHHELAGRILKFKRHLSVPHVSPDGAGDDPLPERIAESLLDPEMEGVLFELGEGVWRLESLCRDVNAFLDAGAAEAPRALSLETELGVAISMLEPHIKGSSPIELRFSEVQPVRAVRACLLRSICFLVLACLDSCKRGGDRESRIVISTRQLGGWGRIEIIENGEGYGVGIRSRLGDLLYLAGRPGLGPLMLGLANDELRLAGGTMGLEGAPGSGTHIKLTLPGTRAAVAMQTLRPEDSDARTGLVLLLEEDELARRALERRLSHHLEIATCNTMAEALPMIAEGRFIAAIVGFSWPESLGIRLLQRSAETNFPLFRNTLVLIPPRMDRSSGTSIARMGALPIPRSTPSETIVALLKRLADNQ